MSSNGGAPPQMPRILKAANLSGDVFVVPSRDAFGALLGVGEVKAVPFVPPRLDEGSLLPPGSEAENELVFAEEAPVEPPPPPPPPPPDPSPEILAAAEAAAAAIVATAESRAAALVTQARQDAANLLEEARQQQEAWQREAYDEGYQHGVQSAQAETVHQLQQAGNLLAEAQQARHTLLADAEPEVIRLVLAIAKKVIRREIALDQSIVVETVKESLRRLGGRSIARVRVNPGEVEALNEAWHELSPLAREIELVPDDQIAPGGCVVESRNGEIDAQVETQVASVTGPLLAMAEAATPVEAGRKQA